MGKKLIIVGADFSQNAINGVSVEMKKFLMYDGHSVFTPDIPIVSGDLIETKFVFSGYQVGTQPYNGIVSGASGTYTNNVGVRVMSPNGNKNLVFDLPNTLIIFPFQWEANTVYSIKTTATSVFVNGVEYTSPSETRVWSGSQIFAIGGALVNGALPYDGFRGKIYSVRIYDSRGLIKHNFEPVKNNQIVDTVTDITYNNVGTGNALYGKDNP